MAILKMRAIREMSAEDIEKKLNEMRLDLMKERGKIKVGGVPENPGRVRQLRRTIARLIMTKAQKLAQTRATQKAPIKKEKGGVRA